MTHPAHLSVRVLGRVVIVFWFNFALLMGPSCVAEHALVRPGEARVVLGASLGTSAYSQRLLLDKVKFQEAGMGRRWSYKELISSMNRNSLQRLFKSSKFPWGNSLVVQWLRLHLPKQGVQVWPWVRELRSHMPRDQKNKILKKNTHNKSPEAIL